MKRVTFAILVSSSLIAQSALAGNPAPAPNGPPAGQPVAQPIQNAPGPQAASVPNPAPAASAPGSLSILKGFKELHGRLDGQSLVPGGIKVATAVAGVKQEIKAPERSEEMVQHVLHQCRVKSGLQPFGPFGMIGPMGIPGPFGIPAPPAPFGDLELLNVGLVSDATPQQGPIYRLTMLNNSPMPAIGFRVSLIAALGEIGDTSIIATIPVKFIAANTTSTVDVQLPIQAMAIGNPAAPFDMLIAVVDSFDELAETTELNNVIVVTRSEIVSVSVKVEAPAAIAAPAPPSGPAPAAAAAPNPADALPTENTTGLPAIVKEQPVAPAQSTTVNLDDVSGAKELLGR